MAPKNTGPKLSKAQAGSKGGFKRAENRKRKAIESDPESSTSLAQPLAQIAARKRSNMTMLDPVSAAPDTKKTNLAVVPEANKSPGIPAHIPGLANRSVQIPLTLVAANGTQVLIGSHRTIEAETKSFWTEVSDLVKNLEEQRKDEVYGTLLNNVKASANLKLHALVFPTLLTRTASLSYSQIPKSAKHIGNQAFKTYLTLIVQNATNMLNEIGNTTLAPATKSQDQAPAEITSRLFSIPPNSTISAEDHNSIVRNIINSTNDTAELVRRELCNFGITVATVAEAAIKAESSSRSISAHVIGMMMDANPDHATSCEKSRGSPAIKQEYQGVEPDGEGSDMDSDGRTDDGKQPAHGIDVETARPTLTLPSVLVRELYGHETHKCRCPEVCEPNFDEALIDHVKQKIRQEEKQQITEEERAKICSDFRSEHEAEAKETARIAINQEALMLARDKKVQIERKQMESQALATATASMKAKLESEKAKLESEFESRAANEVTRRMQNFWALAQQAPPPQAPAPQAPAPQAPAPQAVAQQHPPLDHSQQETREFSASESD